MVSLIKICLIFSIGYLLCYAGFKFLFKQSRSDLTQEYFKNRMILFGCFYTINKK